MAGKKGRSGRRPVPSHLKLVRGTYREDRAPKNEPKPTGKATPPRWLTAEARAEWQRLAPELGRIRLLTRADRALFAAYCEAWADLQRATTELAKASLVVDSPSGYKQLHPLASQKRNAARLLKDLSVEFGLTPAARGRIDIPLGLPGAEGGKGPDDTYGRDRGRKDGYDGLGPRGS